jgi:ribokinase
MVLAIIFLSIINRTFINKNNNKKAMFDIISIGDATEDVFIQVEDYSVRCNKKKADCKLCLDYASKIAATRVDKLIGGNASNAAIGSRRLGLKSAFYVELGNDDQGKKILRSLQKDKVNTKYVKLKSSTKTNYSVVINTKGERTILVHHVDRKYKLPKLDKAKWIYLTSMGKGSEVIYKPLLTYLKKTKAKLVFNPGTHQLKSGKKILSPMLKASEIICLNTEETQLLLKNKTRNFQTLCKGLHKFNKKIVVVTDGPAGSYAYDGKNFYFMPIFDVPIIERTGCGDSFTTAFMCALYYKQPIDEALRWGTLNASQVLQHIGPQQGLAKKSFIRNTLKKHPTFTYITNTKLMYHPKKRRLVKNPYI